MNSEKGIPGVQFKKGQFTGPVDYDVSGTAYIPSGETSVVVSCGFLASDSIVKVDICTVTAETDPICEVVASRTYGANGTFTVGTTTAAVTGADMFFNWMTLRV